MNNEEHSCEEYDGECMGWKGFHGNDHDWTLEDYANARDYDNEQQWLHGQHFQL